MRSKLFPLWAGLCLLALTACNAGTALGVGPSCLTSTALLTQVTGECSRSFETLEETANETVAVSTADVAPFTTVEWRATVEAGIVEVTFTDFHGNAHTTTVSRADPGSGSVRVQLDPLNRLNYTLTPVGGPAEGVAYELNFVCDCMP